MKDIYLFVIILELTFAGRYPFFRISLFHSFKERGIPLFLNYLLYWLTLPFRIIMMTN